MRSDFAGLLLIIAVGHLMLIGIGLDAFGVPAGDLPDHRFTPGATVAVPVTKLCEKGYAGSVRDVDASVKKKVYAECGIKSYSPGQYEIDHLISLELGGSNEIANLWPESYSGKWNAHVKDQLEDRLHALVCADPPALRLHAAQEAIRRNWIAEYRVVFARAERGDRGGKERKLAIRAVPAGDIRAQRVKPAARWGVD